MRIISGLCRGCKLAVPKSHSQSIRPTADRAREGLFNIIQSYIPDSVVLDLFAGTGAVGLEAFSRGASSIVFVERSQTALKLIRENIKRCCSGRQFTPNDFIVIPHDLRRGLPLHQLPHKQFDLIFADPPYGKDISLDILNTLHNSTLLSEHGLLIMEERRSVELPTQLSRLELVDQRKYGEAQFWLYRCRKDPE